MIGVSGWTSLSSGLKKTFAVEPFLKLQIYQNMAKLFTPGPLNTSDSVKKCMLVDVGSRDLNFIDSVANMRRTLVDLADGDQRDYTTVPLQGSGSFVLEAVLLNALGNNSGKVRVWLWKILVQ